MLSSGTLGNLEFDSCNAYSGRASASDTMPSFGQVNGATSDLIYKFLGIYFSLCMPSFWYPWESVVIQIIKSNFEIRPCLLIVVMWLVSRSSSQASVISSPSIRREI